jgi:hypothetical protein
VKVRSSSARKKPTSNVNSSMNLSHSGPNGLEMKKQLNTTSPVDVRKMPKVISNLMKTRTAISLCHLVSRASCVLMESQWCSVLQNTSVKFLLIVKKSALRERRESRWKLEKTFACKTFSPQWEEVTPKPFQKQIRPLLTSILVWKSKRKKLRSKHVSFNLRNALKLKKKFKNVKQLKRLKPKLIRKLERSQLLKEAKRKIKVTNPIWFSCPLKTA